MSKSLGHDISVRQHSKSEHLAPCHIQAPLRYDWKIVESDVKPESNKQTKWVDVQANLSLSWSHRSYCRFIRVLAHFGILGNATISEHSPDRGGSRMISKGFELINLPYILYAFGKTGLSKQCRPWSDAASDQGLHCLPLMQQFYSHS